MIGEDAMPQQTRDKQGRFARSDGNGRPQLQTSIDPQVSDLVANVLMTRSGLWKKFLQPRTDINDECGFPTTSELTAADYRDLYDREAVAARVVEVMPHESWLVSPSIYEDEDVDNDTPFEVAWAELCNLLRGIGWYQGDEGNPIWEALRRADVLSGIGSYGVLLLGLDDGKELLEPVEGISPNGSSAGSANPARKLLYLRAFDESLTATVQYENDQSNPRYGMPTLYNLTFNDPLEARGGFGAATTSHQVHWTRVIHLADNLGSSEVWGVPRVRPVYNNLINLRKLYHGSAQMYWQGAFPGLALEMQPQHDYEFGPEDKDALREQLEKYMTGLQRYLALQGLTVKSIAPQVVDPTPQIDVQIEAICIRLGIPKRIFSGSERGELSSSQDQRAWNSRVQRRQNGYLTPRIIVPLVDRLIALGVLPVPESYQVVWPDLDALTEEEQATIAAKRTEALAKYVQGQVETLIPPLDYLVRILKMPREEAVEVLEAAMEQQTITVELVEGEESDEA